MYVFIIQTEHTELYTIQAIWMQPFNLRMMDLSLCHFAKSLFVSFICLAFGHFTNNCSVYTLGVKGSKMLLLIYAAYFLWWLKVTSYLWFSIRLLFLSSSFIVVCKFKMHNYTSNHAKIQAHHYLLHLNTCRKCWVRICIRFKHY